jgi:hypothetical protein
VNDLNYFNCNSAGASCRNYCCTNSTLIFASAAAVGNAGPSESVSIAGPPRLPVASTPPTETDLILPHASGTRNLSEIRFSIGPAPAAPSTTTDAARLPPPPLPLLLPVVALMLKEIAPPESSCRDTGACATARLAPAFSNHARGTILPRAISPLGGSSKTSAQRNAVGTVSWAGAAKYWKKLAPPPRSIRVFSNPVHVPLVSAATGTFFNPNVIAAVQPARVSLRRAVAFQ